MLVRTNLADMKTTPADSHFVTLPHLAPRRADWTRRSRAAVGRTEGGKVAVAIGSGAVETGSRDGEHVDVFLVPGLTDEQMQSLAAAEAAGAPLTALAGAMRLLVEVGLSPANAGLVLGLPDKAEVSRLNAIAQMPRAVLRELARLGLTRNHARWLLGLPEAEMLGGLSELESELQRARGPEGSGLGPESRRKRRRGRMRQIGISVADVRRWRASLTTSTAPTAVPADPAVLSAAASESARLSEVLGAPVEIEVGATDGRNVRMGFFSVEALAGLMQHLGHATGDAPAPPEGAGMRWLAMDGITDDELAYLTGTADS